MAKMRKAKFEALTVNVVCPYCGEPQPNSTGSDMWDSQDVLESSQMRRCNAFACQKEMLVGMPPNKVDFA